jgi:4'-phosphopantetheinyl transferase EntD
MIDSNEPHATFPILREIESDLVLCVDLILNSQGDLMPDELSLTQDMTPRRVREFRAVRNVARRALVALGETASALPQGTFGEPIWPHGVTGSLSHTAYLAGALVSHKNTIRSVGIDLNDHRALGDAADELMSGTEITAASQLGLFHDVDAIKNLLFSAKEALFKCQFPLTRLNDLGYMDVELTVRPGEGCISAKLLRPLDASAVAVISKIQILPMQIQGVMAALAILRNSAIV